MKRTLNILLLGGFLLLFQGCLSMPGVTIQFSGVERGPDGAAQVKAIEGEGQFRAGKELNWRRMAAGTILPPGSEIRTDNKARVNLGFPDGSALTVAPDSLVSVKSSESPVVGDPRVLLVTLQIAKGELEGTIQGGSGATTFKLISPDGSSSSFTPAAGKAAPVAVFEEPPTFNNPEWGTSRNAFGSDWSILQIPKRFPAGLLILACPLFLFCWSRRGRRDLATLTTSKSSVQAPRFQR